MAVFSEKGASGTGREAVPGLSTIGAGMRVAGDISADGVVKIEGSVTGTVRAAKQVLVARGGEVEGDVVSREAIIGGGSRCHLPERSVELRRPAWSMATSHQSSSSRRRRDEWRLRGRRRGLRPVSTREPKRLSREPGYHTAARGHVDSNQV
jgi:hypothetical protein